MSSCSTTIAPMFSPLELNPVKKEEELATNLPNPVKVGPRMTHSTEGSKMKTSRKSTRPYGTRRRHSLSTESSGGNSTGSDGDRGNSSDKWSNSERKRERNKEAAKRYRENRKRKQAEIFNELVSLEFRNHQLRTTLATLQQKIRSISNLLSRDQLENPKTDPELRKLIKKEAIELEKDPIDVLKLEKPETFVQVFGKVQDTKKPNASLTQD